MLSISHLLLPTASRTTWFSIPTPKPSHGFFRVLSSSTSGERQEPSLTPAEGRKGESALALSTSVPFPPIKAAKRVVLVRHGQSTWNAEGRIQGSSDFSVLTAKGESQAETSRLMLLDDRFDVCFSSPLKRSRRTAEIIWGDREEAVLTDYDLREIDLYSFQGLLKHEGKEKYGDKYRQWQKDAPNFVIDGHYPARELWARARNCWDRILAHDGRSVLVVAHNAVNQALVATAIGLETDYFRVLLQSNCGVSVLDFTPGGKSGSLHVCLNRLNQTPGPPVSAESSGGRKTSERIILVCHGSLQTNAEVGLPNRSNQPMSMLGQIQVPSETEQAQKTAELILDCKINTIFSSPRKASKETATAISRFQEAADCLGADCVPRNVNIKELEELDVESILQKYDKATDQSPNPQITSPIGFQDGAVATLWKQTGNAWQSLLDYLSSSATSDPQTLVVVAHPGALVALMAHCLNLTEDWLVSFHVDEGSVSIIDLPDGPAGKGVFRCINYTAHLGKWSVPITKPKVDEEELH